METGSVSQHVLACCSFICSLRDLFSQTCERAAGSICIFKRQVNTEGVHHTSQKSEAVGHATDVMKHMLSQIHVDTALIQCSLSVAFKLISRRTTTFKHPTEILNE